MSLEFLMARSGRRGRPIAPERIRRLEAIVDEVAHQSIAITARRLFYRLVSRGDIHKTERAYGQPLEDPETLRTVRVAEASERDVVRLITAAMGERR